MSYSEIKIEGYERTLSFFQMAKLKSSDKVMEICKSGAQEVRTLGRKRAPKETGKLRKSIRIKKCKTGDGYMTKAYSYLAHFHEYGTKRGIKAKKFMDKAREEVLPRVQKELIEAIKDVVDDK